MAQKKVSIEAPGAGPCSFTATARDRGGRLDEFLAVRLPRHALKVIRRLADEGHVLVNGEEAARHAIVREDDLIVVDIPADLPVRYTPEKAAIAVLHEDEHILVIDKAPGAVVGEDRWSGEGPRLMNALLHYLQVDSPFARAGTPARPALVHRLDRDTSGCLVVAKDIPTARELSRQFEDREVEKVYLAVVRGEPREDEGVIDLPIRESWKRPGVMEVGEKGGKPAETRWRVVERFRGYAVVEAAPRTGRTHQIRVHLAAIDHPLAVDPVYGASEGIFLSLLKPVYKAKRGHPERPVLGRMPLHALRVTLRPPHREAPLTVEAPVPEDIERLLKTLRKYRSNPA